MSNQKGEIKRVLVWLDYGEDDPESGEIFDLTALVAELFSKSDKQQAKLYLEVNADCDYSAPKVNERYPAKMRAMWRVMADYEFGQETGILTDAINSGMPDSIATQELRKKLQKLSAKVAEANEEIGMQKLRDAAAVRSKYPIARISAPALGTAGEAATLAEGTA